MNEGQEKQINVKPLLIAVAVLFAANVWTLIQLHNLEQRMNFMEDDQTIMLQSVKRAADMMIDWTMQHGGAWK